MDVKNLLRGIYDVWKKVNFTVTRLDSRLIWVVSNDGERVTTVTASILLNVSYRLLSIQASCGLQDYMELLCMINPELKATHLKLII